MDGLEKMEEQEKQSMTNKLITLDLSTTSTGFAWLNYKTKELLMFDVIKPSVANKKLYDYPELPLLKMRSISEKIINCLTNLAHDFIIIEEINRGKNRFSQKTLDGLHFILLDAIEKVGLLNKVYFVDSDGNAGWRSEKGLNLRLSEKDKMINKDNRKFNKTLPPRSKNKKAIIDKKTLACRFVNNYFNLALDATKAGHADMADAIGLGIFYMEKRL